MKNEERVTVLPYPFTFWAVVNRFHFDFISLKKVLKNDYDFDIILTSQPELTGNLYTVFNPPGRDMRFAIPIVQYLHYLAVPEGSHYQETCFIRQVEGILYSKFTGINSKWAKRIFMRNVAKLKEVSPFINKRGESYIDKTLQPLYLGTPLDEIDACKNRGADELTQNSKERAIYKELFEEIESHKTIVFNHRLMNYTGAEVFTDLIGKLFKKRKDFLLWFTDPNFKAFFARKKFDMLPNMIRSSGVPWRAYIALLSRTYFGACCHPQYSAWCLSLIDGMADAKPYLVPRAFAFPEIVGDDYLGFFSNDEKVKSATFLEKAEYWLDNELEVKRVGALNRKRVEDKFNWDRAVDGWLKVLDDNVSFEFGEETEAMIKLKQLVRKRGMASKRLIFEEMKWSADFNTKVTFRRYRNYLLSNDFVENIDSGKVVFMPKTGGQTLLGAREPEVELKLDDDVEEEIEVEI